MSFGASPPGSLRQMLADQPLAEVQALPSRDAEPSPGAASESLAGDPGTEPRGPALQPL
jgi:hypothetical protein